VVKLISCATKLHITIPYIKDGRVKAYGTTTKQDLSGVGRFMMMVLFGVCIAALVNLVLGNPLIDYVMSIISVLVFAGLTAYDTTTPNPNRATDARR